VCAATLDSFALLGIQPAALLSAAKPRLSDWITNWDTVRTGPAIATDEGVMLYISAAPQSQQHADKQQLGSGREPSAVAGTFAKSDGSSLAGASPAFAAGGQYVKAHLQSIGLPDSTTIHVLHWRHYTPTAGALVSVGAVAATAAVDFATDADSVAVAAEGDGTATARTSGAASTSVRSEAAEAGGASSPDMLQLQGANAKGGELPPPSTGPGSAAEASSARSSKRRVRSTPLEGQPNPLQRASRPDIFAAAAAAAAAASNSSSTATPPASALVESAAPGRGVIQRRVVRSSGTDDAAAASTEKAPRPNPQAGRKAGIESGEVQERGSYASVR
jgi:hypothetical protein